LQDDTLASLADASQSLTCEISHASQVSSANLSNKRPPIPRIAVRPHPWVWLKWGKFKEDRDHLDKAREVFQTALEFFGDDDEQIERHKSSSMRLPKWRRV